MVFKRSIDFQDSVRKIELILLATCAVEQWMRCLFVDGKDGFTILINMMGDGYSKEQRIIHYSSRILG